VFFREAATLRMTDRYRNGDNYTNSKSCRGKWLEHLERIPENQIPNFLYEYKPKFRR
jgi:hypothetical protein